MHSFKSRRRKEGPCQAPVPPLWGYQAPALPSSISQRPQPYHHSKLLNHPNPRLRHLLLRICGYDVHPCREAGRPTYAEKANVRFPPSVPHVTWYDVRRALEIALFISPVNRSAPVTTSENDTHLPTKRWRLLTETIEHARVCSIRSRNFSFFSGIRWNTSREESDRKPKYGTILRGIRIDLGKPRKYPSLIRKYATKKIADFAAANYVHRDLQGSHRLLGWVRSEVGHCAGHQCTMNKVSPLIGRN